MWEILHTKCMCLTEVVREVNRLLELFKSPGAAVAWVTHWKCPFSNRESKVIYHCLLAGYNISLCWHVLSKKPSSQLGYWPTAPPCTLHFLPFSRLFWINVTLQCTDSFQSSLELFNCLWGFPSKLFFLWCKIENKSFCQIWRKVLLLLNFLSFFVTKRVRRVFFKKMHTVSLICAVCQNNGYCGFQILVELLLSLAAAVRTCCVRQECTGKAVVLLPWSLYRLRFTHHFRPLFMWTSSTNCRACIMSNIQLLWSRAVMLQVSTVTLKLKCAKKPVISKKDMLCGWEDKPFSQVVWVEVVILLT